MIHAVDIYPTLAWIEAASLTNKAASFRRGRLTRDRCRGSPGRQGCYVFFFGTFAPAFRASDRPIAIACLRLVTFSPDELRNVPRLRSCIVFSTLSWVFFP